MTCDEAVALLDDYADGLLTPERATALEAHLEKCSSCRAELESLQTLLADARRSQGPSRRRREPGPRSSNESSTVRRPAS